VAELSIVEAIPASVKTTTEDFECISREDRLRRIGEILHRGVQRALTAGLAHTHSKTELAHTDSKTEQLTDFQERILSAIRALNEAPARNIRASVSGSRANLALNLRVLLDLGLIQRTGLTRQARYSITGKLKVMNFSTSKLAVQPAAPAEGGSPEL
jgi:hypothetical protein